MVATPHCAVGESMSARLAVGADLLRRGRIDQLVHALVDRDGGDNCGEDCGEDGGGVALTALLTECHLAQGELGSALALADDLRAAPALARAHHALAELASATGEPELALERFLAVAHASGADDLLLPWRAGAALELLRLGRHAEALGLARAQHDLARRDGAPYDRALALRVLATIDASVGTGGTDARVARLREALALLVGVEAGRLRAQVQTDLAGLLVLAGSHDEALSMLRSAEAYAGREDLWPLQSRVRRLLDRLGEAPRRAEAEALALLTAAERRVALLAIRGLSNRQVAEQLHVSVKAVEGHLSKVYRKLGKPSRAALVASFAPR